MAAHLVVARVVRAHGLRGEALVEPLTDAPAEVFTPGRRLAAVDAAGAAVGAEVTVARVRRQSENWLLAFDGVTSRTLLEARGLKLLGARREELRPLAPGAMYLHELPGAEVVAKGEVIGVVRDLAGASGAELLVVEGRGGEHLIPFRAPIVTRLDRAARRIEVDLPPGLLEL